MQWSRLAELVASERPLATNLRPVDRPVGLDYDEHNTLISFAYVAALTSQSTQQLSILDWGGGLGQYALLARSVLPGVVVDYHCRDLGPMVATGRELLADATFHDNDASAFGRMYDLVMASSSLQYIESWSELLHDLAGVTTKHLYVTRLPVTESASYVSIQHAQRHGYDTAYPGWVLNRREFIEASSRERLRLVREFIIAEQPHIPRAPAQPDYRGFLFAPKQDRPR